MILNLRLTEFVNTTFLRFLQSVKIRKNNTRYLDDDDGGCFSATHNHRRPPKMPSTLHSNIVGTSHYHCDTFHQCSEMHRNLPWKPFVYSSRVKIVISSCLIWEFWKVWRCRKMIWRCRKKQSTLLVFYFACFICTNGPLSHDPNHLLS